MSGPSARSARRSGCFDTIPETDRQLILRTVVVATNIMPPDQLAAQVEALGIPNVGESAHEVETHYGLRSGSPGGSSVL